MLIANKKAISPVLAVLLMVALAVIAALITYSWIGSYIVSTTGRAGHAIQIQSIDWTKTNPNLTEVTVYIQNVGEGSVTFTDAYVDGEKIKEKGFGTINEGETATVILKVHKAFSNGEKIRIKIVCEIGIFAEGTYLVEGI
jgi:flagellin-like protein